MAVWPNVIEEENGVKRAYDIPSRLLMDRIIMLTDEINSATANSIIGQLLFLEKEDNKKPITLYINSPGGSVTDGFAIYDVINPSNQMSSKYYLHGNGCFNGSFLISSRNRQKICYGK